MFQALFFSFDTCGNFCPAKPGVLENKTIAESPAVTLAQRAQLRGPWEPLPPCLTPLPRVTTITSLRSFSISLQTICLAVLALIITRTLACRNGEIDKWVQSCTVITSGA